MIKRFLWKRTAALIETVNITAVKALCIIARSEEIMKWRRRAVHSLVIVTAQGPGRKALGINTTLGTRGTRAIDSAHQWGTLGQFCESSAEKAELAALRTRQRS